MSYGCTREVAKHERSVRVARGDGKRLTAVSVGVRISNVLNQILSNTLILTRFANEADPFPVISSMRPACVAAGRKNHDPGAWISSSQKLERTGGGERVESKIDMSFCFLGNTRLIYLSLQRALQATFKQYDESLLQRLHTVQLKVAKRQTSTELYHPNSKRSNDFQNSNLADGFS